MKKIVPLQKIVNYLVVVIAVIYSTGVFAQTYTTIANGSWTSAATWQGGVVPNAGNIPTTAVINIKHVVTITGSNILNNGTINIANPGGLSPRLIVASGLTFTNASTGKVYINNAEYRQYRFIGAGESGTPQTGSFINAGGYVEIRNSYVEVAENFENKNWGSRKLYNTSVTLGKDYNQNSNSIDTLLYSSVSVGWHNTGDFMITGSNIHFQDVKVQVASALGVFKLSGVNANGTIENITLKNHKTNITGGGTISVMNSANTAGGLFLNSYCVATPVNYIPNGKVSGSQTSSCSILNFPAPLMASLTQNIFDFTANPVLISGTDKQAGAVYKYESVAPGMDVHVQIDSLVNGAKVAIVDDNGAGVGFIEGFQPHITPGGGIGTFYAVFTLRNMITGTNIPLSLSSFTLTALDIDGNSSLREFNEIGMGTGATAAYVNNNPGIQITQPTAGSFRGTNIDNKTVNGIDTSAKQYMFTVSNTNLSSYTVKVGMIISSNTTETRKYSMVTRGFVYPQMTTLPVKMESFTATLNNTVKKVDLKWVTATEENVSHFVVEKSFDGVNYSDAGLVFAFGNTTTNKSYTLKDDVSTVQSGVIYYRIRTVDNDGKFEFSSVRVIRISKQAENAINIVTYPNPASTQLNITLPSGWQNKKVMIELFNANGQVAKRIENFSSSQTETINIGNLQPGFYIVRAICDGATAQQKIIKQ